MHTLATILILQLQPFLATSTPAPAVSVGRAAATFLVVGSVHRPRRPPLRTGPPTIGSWVDVPDGMAGEVTWSLFDLNGRRVRTGQTVISEAGPRRLFWDHRDGSAPGMYAVQLIDGRGRSYAAMVVILPN